ncbi:hypothetical protein P4O66_006378 [Electrophorus voltai]|uniref:Tf2-1-like SH3-like domain-containing protein n=1 Tax=Electrophorus voltai TaxID=2609070 RepID=A0AAD8ZIV9_9TELE|nr:hypothetical protein P4O66_006378 [Electrophorus voltai]
MRRELQRFSGYATFYRRFIKSFIALARPLTNLLMGKPKQLRWGEAAERAFADLKTAFSTSPVLQQPDLEEPFRNSARSKTPSQVTIPRPMAKWTGVPAPPFIPGTHRPSVEQWCRCSEQVWEETTQETALRHRGLQKKGRLEAGNDPQFEPGQKVWVATKDGRVGPLGKLQAKYEDPCTITNRVNEVTYRLGLPEHSWVSRAFHMSALQPMVEAPFTEERSSSVAPLLPLEIGDEPAYRVRALLDSRRRTSGL